MGHLFPFAAISKIGNRRSNPLERTIEKHRERERERERQKREENKRERQKEEEGAKGE